MKQWECKFCKGDEKPGCTVPYSPYEAGPDGCAYGFHCASEFVYWKLVDNPELLLCPKCGCNKVMLLGFERVDLLCSHCNFNWVLEKPEGGR